jgi:hypothetical protein
VVSFFIAESLCATAGLNTDDDFELEVGDDFEFFGGVEPVPVFGICIH